MVTSPPPSVLLAESFNALLLQLPGVRDGDEEAIHQARIEIRRTREVLSLAHATDEARRLDRLDRLLRATGRVLGRARDADIMFRFVQDLEMRFRGAARVLALLRSTTNRRRQAMRRAAVRKLERTELERVPGELGWSHRRGLFELRAGRGARAGLQRQIGDRAAALRRAIDHAGGVHFSGRLHDTRIAARRLRYALELADRMGLTRPQGARRALRRTQATLGDLHDRDVLLATLGELQSPDQAFANELEILTQFISAEAAQTHARYLEYRTRLLEVCDGCEELAAPRHVDRRLIAAAALMPLLVLWTRRAATSRPAGDRVRSAPAGERRKTAS